MPGGIVGPRALEVTGFAPRTRMRRIKACITARNMVKTAKILSRARAGACLAAPGAVAGATVDALRIWQHLADSSRPVPRDALLLCQKASDLAFAGRWTEAEAILAEAVGPLEDADAPQAAAANHNLAAALQERGDSDGAVLHGVRALFLYNREEDLGGIFAALRNLAVIHAARGESGLATAAQHQAARVRGELFTRGLLEAADTGLDSRGERICLLGIDALHRRPAAALAG
jgi:tetratricopeptide (TPR) repeat protein